MDDKEHLRHINFALEHFGHLLSAAERSAATAVVLTVWGSTPSMVITPMDGSEPTEEIRSLLADGQAQLRRRLGERLLEEHRGVIYSNSCGKCGTLPRTPRAKQCPACGHSWRSED